MQMTHSHSAFIHQSQYLLEHYWSLVYISSLYTWLFPVTAALTLILLAQVHSIKR